MKTPTAEKRLAGFVAKFAPEPATLIRAARRRMRALLPNALELIYDNYNFLVIGYGPSEKAGEAIFSLAAQAKGVNLCFLQGAGLPDPHALLQGSGNAVRNIRLQSAQTLDRPAVRSVINAALKSAKSPLLAGSSHKLIIKSVSATQRPRRAAATRRR
jgi:hypothetical protein